jgi:hypothetical protein
MPRRARPAKQEIEISYAYDAETLGNQLIDQHHGHLIQAKILWLFTTQERKKCDRVRAASAAKLPPLQRFLASGTAASVQDGHDFLILIDVKQWGQLAQHQRLALVDHELSHCSVSDSGKWTIVGHDVEELTHIIARHGLWRNELAEMGKVSARQLHLLTDEVDRSPISAEARAELERLLGDVQLDPSDDPEASE